MLLIPRQESRQNWSVTILQGAGTGRAAFSGLWRPGVSQTLPSRGVGEGTKAARARAEG